MKIKLNKTILNILDKLEKNNFKAYLVGGCVRDLLLEKKPKDWDVATNAEPERVQQLFSSSFINNSWGTVVIQTKSKQPELRQVEVTTFRIEQKYSDKRHPDQVKFTASLKKDLARRDFTINALAMDKQGKITDLFQGQKDLKNKLIKTVGNPEDRFNEDALRMLRAVRLATQLKFSAKGGPASGWKIELKTKQAIKKNSVWLQAVAKERIRDELIQIIMSEQASQGIKKLKQTNLLKYIIPELEKGIGVNQNKHHIYTIYQHAVLSLEFAARRNYNLEVRLAALLHDIAKPQTKQGQGPESTFYNHDILGAKVAFRILTRLKFPKKIAQKISLLVRNHMFVYNVDEVSEAGVRRLLRRVGKENIDELIQLRIADRLGSGCPKAVPYKLRHLQYVIDKVSQDPISAKMMKIDGHDLMKHLKLKPGPRLGLLINALLSQVLENPKLNTKEKLLKKAKELNMLSDKELKDKSKLIEQKKLQEDWEIKNKHWVK